MNNRVSPEKKSLSTTAFSTSNDNAQSLPYPSKVVVSSSSTLTQRTNPVKELDPEIQMKEDLEKPLLSSNMVDVGIEEEIEEEEEGEEREEEPAGSVHITCKVILSGFLWSFCSSSMVLVNKSLASSYNHFLVQGNLNILILVFQAIIAVVAVQICKMMKLVEYPSFELSTAVRWAPVNLLFCGMLFTGMASLQHNSVPMVTVFKNLTNIGICFGDVWFFNAKVEALVIAAFGIMLGGAILAAHNDVEVDAVGLFWMTLNCLATAGYVLYIKFATKTIKLSKFGMVFYNNLLCFCFLLPVTLLNGEMKSFVATKSIHTIDYFLKNSFAGFVGFFLNFASLNFVSCTGPTTYAIVGSLNKIPTAILGSVMFNAEITRESWFFIGVSMCGGFLYSYAKIRSAMKNKK